MEDTVSVLTWECWLWEDTMDMTDCARLLLPGSSETGRGKGTRSALAPVSGRRAEPSPRPPEARTAAASPGPRPHGVQMQGPLQFCSFAF